jgi:hypothetical protein
MNKEKTLKPEDYPVLFRESSNCAACNQKKHFQLLAIRIALLIGYAVLGAVTWTKITNLSLIPLVIITIALSMTLIFTLILEMRKYDRLWFTSRAIAEIVKKETWLFMMRAEPYDASIPEDKAEENFVDSIKDILDSNQGVIPELAKYKETGTQVTDRIKELRKTSVPERLKTYIDDRLQDQRDWYMKKAKFNLSQESHFTILMWVFQALTVIFAVINILAPTASFNLIGVATTTAAAILLWANTKSYRELSQSYSLIGQELCFYEDKTRYISTEQQLTEFVSKVEQTMDRERNAWNVRRLPIIKPN